MSRPLSICTLTAVLSTSAIAQDSVSKIGGLPGDAVSPYDTTEQVNHYVLDLTPFNASWGTPFNVGPLAKSSQPDPGFFGSLISAQAHSATLMTNQPFPSSQYAVWNGPGFGVNGDPSRNDAPNILNRSGKTHQFAAAFAEFSGNWNGVVSVVANYRPNKPRRLYCTRIVAAGNGHNSAQNSAQIGFGGVDADSNVTVRADDFGVIPPNDIVGQNIFRIRSMDRNPAARNVIDINGLSDTGEWLVVKSGTSHNVFTMIPTDRAGRPIAVGGNFNDEYVYENLPGTVVGTLDHLGALSAQRGNVSYSIAKAFPDTFTMQSGTPKGSLTSGLTFESLGTLALYGVGTETRHVMLWDTNKNGSVSDTLQFEFPNSITDNDDAHVLSPVDGSVHYRSQTPFRGGNGPIAVCNPASAGGKVMIATPVVADAGPSDQPIGAIAVGRFDRANPSSTIEWTLAGWNDFVGGFATGKPILDGPGGNAIGQLVRLSDVTGGSPAGPSTSAPTFDAAGNVWFVAAVELFRGAFSDFDSALIRAVYDPVSFSYELELVMELGQVFRGQNSNRDYQITFMGMADSNSISSGAYWSGNMMQVAHGGMDTTGLPSSDPRHLGGLVVSCEITYDVNDDGTFDTGTGDEDYNVLLFIGSE